MVSKKSFYDSGNGDPLIDAKNYPIEIKRYLRYEKKFLYRLRNEFEVLVEVGCMTGRYLEWSLEYHKKYIGVDIVSRYIKQGKERLKNYKLVKPDYQIEICSAESIGQFLLEKCLANSSKLLLLFPFNSFGNMKNPEAVIASLSLVNQPFLICSYKTDMRANTARLIYYKRCGYEQTKYERNGTGVHFISVEGLETTAYHPEYIRSICQKHGMRVETEVSGIGAFYKRVIK